MAGHEKFERVEPIGETEPRQKVQMEPSDTSEAVSKVKFDEALQKADPSRVERRAPANVSEEVTKATAMAQSPIELAKSTSLVPKVASTPKDLASQAADLRQQLQRPRAVLLDVGMAPIERGSIAKLSAHLEHMDRALQDATKLTSGVEAGSLVPSGKPPLVQFLTFLTDGDKRLSTMVDELKGLDLSKQKMTPEKLLAIQVKMNFISQELEFFSTTLNKALESTKTIMNIQI
jgi:hypothetical protein